MNAFEIVFCHVLCIVAFGVATYIIFDGIRLYHNQKIYERTSLDCNGMFCSWPYIQFLDSRLDRKIETLSTDEYIKEMNVFRKSVGLQPLTKKSLKCKIK